VVSIPNPGRRQLDFDLFDPSPSERHHVDQIIAVRRFAQGAG
jgi:hypothetical protein